MDPLSEPARAASNPTASPGAAQAKLDPRRSFSSAAQSTRSIKDLVNRFNSQATHQGPTSQRIAPRARLQRPRSPSTSAANPRPARPNGATSPIKTPSRRNKLQASASLSASRRESDGSISEASSRSTLHKRSRSNVEYDLPAPLQSRRSRATPNHRRSRSNYAGSDSNTPALTVSTTSFSSLPRHASRPLPSPSRIPVPRKTDAIEPISPTTARNISQMGSSPNHFPASTPPRRVLAKQPPAFNASPSGLPAPASSSRRYDPLAHPRHTPTGQSLKAFIHAPPPQKSPPLRSSRPRQPVSTASTAASQARSGQRFESALATKQNDPAKFRSKKKIPELEKITSLAARKERIQRAFSDHSVSAPNSVSGSGAESRRVSNATSTRGDSQNGYYRDLDSSFEQTDADDTDAEHTDAETVEPPNSLSPTTPRNIPGAFIDYDDSPLSVKQVMPSSDAPDSSMYSETEFSPQPNGYQELVIEEEPSSPLDSCDESFSDEQAGQSSQPTTLLSQVMKMRERSVSSASRTDFEEGSSFAPSDSGDQASIHIMLGSDDAPAGQTPASQSGEWSSDLPSSSPPAPYHPSSSPPVVATSDTSRVADSDEDSFASDAAEVGLSSPWLGHAHGVPTLEETGPETPRKSDFISPTASTHPADDDKTPRQSKRVGRASVLAVRSDWNHDSEAYGAVNRIASQYKETGSLSPEMLHEFQQHVGALSPNLSKAEAADADSMSFLLESMLREQGGSSEPKKSTSDFLSPSSYNPVDRLDMQTPEEDVRGSAIIYSTTYRRSASSLPRASQDALNDNSYLQAFSPSSVMVNTPASQYEAGTPASQYSGVSTPAMQPDAVPGANDDDDYRPPPPPKDIGYSPRSSTGQHSIRSLNQILPSSARNSKTSDRLQLPEIPTGAGLGLTMTNSPEDTTKPRPPLPQPHHAPPPPPPSKSGQQLEVVLTDASPVTTFASQPTSPVSARPRVSEERIRNFTTPARPSMESAKPEMVPLPPSQSMSSFQSSIRPSVDYGAPPATMPPSPHPDQGRLARRKHIIKELVDTEYSYHQDMKIIEDIYKATVGDMITADDKKVLFGNVDQIEAFSLEFYDAVRRAVASVYVPPKSARWQSKRGSFSTSNSDGNQPAENSIAAEIEKDRQTRIGEVFQIYVSRMEKVYGTYLKNHELANQRLAKLQQDPTVQCWLTECHNNANDITTAWNLDSLIVKPVQRLLKYPLLLRELTEVTPEDHPDRKGIEESLKLVIGASQRINENKKRADLVEQVISRQRGKSEVGKSMARLFGRGTDKVKDGLGAAQSHKDPEFEEIASKFGGHYLKLQIVMRDVQNSMTELEGAIKKILSFAQVLEEYLELGPSTAPEIESKWRKFVLAIRELCTVAFPDHKNRIQQHVIQPMLTGLKLSEGSQNAIAKRKKRIADYVNCKAMQQAGKKPDKKLIEAHDLYEALNEQLKIELPKLYGLTADLVKACLDSNVYLQGQWMWLWKEKLAPVIDFVYAQPDEITPAFAEDYEFVHSAVLSLGICNGSALADIANFLSPQTTLIGDETVSSHASMRRPSILPNGQRTMSISSENPPLLTPNDFSKSFNGALPSPSALPDTGQPGYYGRMRSSSSLSNRGRAPSVANPNNSLPPSRMPSLVPKSSFSANRPSTAQRPADLKHMASRISLDTAKRSPSVRPSSAVSRQEHQERFSQEPRFSGMFSSAMPMSDINAPVSPGPMSPQHAPEDTPVMFVAASLFEFNIDRARREAGYPYLTYVEGEVFDVIAQKGELWLAKNQDDPTNSLGWIWEQHFVILSQES